MGRPRNLGDTAGGLRRVAVRFWPYVRRERTVVAASSVALTAEVGLRLLEPWPLKFVFDRVLGVDPGVGRGAALVRNLEPITVLTLCAVAVVLFAALRALASYANTVGFALVGNRVLTRVRDDLFRHLQGLSLSFHSRARGGDLTVRVIGDVGLLKDVAVTALVPMVVSAAILVGMVGLMFWLQWQLALVALSVLPLFWLRTLKLSGRIRTVSREQRQREGALAATTAESMGAIKLVQALSLEDTFSESFRSASRKSLKDGVRMKRLEASLGRTVDVLIAVATGLVLWFGALLTLRGALTPGDLLVFLAYLKNAFKPVQDFAKYTGRLAKAAAAGERVLDILDRRPAVEDRPGALPLPRDASPLVFQDVGFEYEPGQPVLQGIDLEVRPGEIVAIVGPSGSGKSTLAALVSRLHDPAEGRITLGGRDLREYTLRSLRARVSLVLQDSLLFALTIRENIALGAPGATPEQVEASARLVGAHGFIEALPEGYETAVGERGVTLSGGQRQRLALARAALRDASVLILDEPTTGLDEENREMVAESLERLARSRMSLLVTHDLRLARRADRILYLEAGRVVETGTHERLLALGGRYATVYRLQDALAARSPAPGRGYALTG